MLTDASGKPIATMAFAVCKNGHVNEAPGHATAAFTDPVQGTREVTVLCARCQYELLALTCAAELMEHGTTREQAIERAAELKRGRELELMALASPPHGERS